MFWMLLVQEVIPPTCQHITLVAERYTCASCIDAIEGFVTKRPWITVEVRFLDAHPFAVGP